MPFAYAMMALLGFLRGENWLGATLAVLAAGSLATSMAPPFRMRPARGIVLSAIGAAIAGLALIAYGLVEQSWPFWLTGLAIVGCVEFGTAWLSWRSWKGHSDSTSLRAAGRASP